MVVAAGEGVLVLALRLAMDQVQVQVHYLHCCLRICCKSLGNLPSQCPSDNNCWTYCTTNTVDRP
jgi:hypothetical protein